MHSGYPPKLVERCRKVDVHPWHVLSGVQGRLRTSICLQDFTGVSKTWGMKGAELARKRHFKCLDMSHGRRFAHPTPARQVAITSNPGSDSVSGPFVPGRGSTLL